MSDLSPNRETRWLPIRNDSGERIPAFGLVEPSEVITLNRRKIQTVVKPTENSLDRVMLNSPSSIKIDGFGSATRAFPNFAKYDTDDGAPVNGEIWGSVGGSFALGKGQFGFRIIGGVNTEKGIVEVDQSSGVHYPCGDLLVGWNPLSTPDTDTPNVAGHVGFGNSVLRADDEPNIGGVNTTSLRPGVVSRYAWEFDPLPNGIFTSCLWTATDTPNLILDFNQDFSFRFVFSTDTVAEATYVLWDLRGGVTVSLDITPGLARVGVAFNHDDGVGGKTFFGGDNIEVGIKYEVKVRWKQSTRVGDLSVTPLPAFERLDFEAAAALPGDIVEAETNYGFFLATNSQGTGDDFSGTLEALGHWQKHITTCEADDDYNHGEPRELPAANEFSIAGGGIHRRALVGHVRTTDATVTEVMRKTIPTDTTISFLVQASAFRTNGNSAGSYLMHVCAANHAGALTFTARNMISTATNLAGSILNINTAGTDLIFTVKGQVARDVTWWAEAFELLSVN